MDTDKASTEAPEWQRLWEIFHQAREIDAEGRASFLNAISLDADSRKKLEELLAADESSSNFFENAVAQELQFLQGDEPSDHDHASNEILAGRFRIIRLIGKGGMGAVYEAFDQELNSVLALKIMRADLALDPAARERFHREINLAREITHPNACRIFDLFHHEQSLFLTMELLRGETLHQRIQREGRMNTRDAMEIVLQIVDAMTAIHHLGIVHRDLKSNNILLVPQGDGFRVVITDFGLATTLPGRGSLRVTETGQVLGTPEFMAPEQLTKGEITPATDVYALGLVMYEMVTGEVPLAKESSLTIAARRISEDAPTPRSVVPELDRNWERTILRCLERNPKHRFHSTSDVGAALKGSSIATRFPVFPTRHRAVQMFQISLLLIGTVLLFLIMRSRFFSGSVSRTDMVTKRLWTGATGTPAGVLSTDGKILIDVDWQTADLAAIEFADGKKRLLTRSGIFFYPHNFSEYPRVTTLSNDGKRVAYSVAHVPDQGCDLRIVDVSGSTPRTLLSRRETCPDPVDWSSDGLKILTLFRNSDGTANISVVSPENGSVRHLKSLTSADVQKICFSPDGQYAIYDFPQEKGSANHDVYLLALKDGEQTTLVRHKANDYVLGWAPDGGRILFASDRSGAYDAWILPISKGIPRVPDIVRKDIGQIFPLRIAPNGAFYYSHLLTSYDLYTATLNSEGNRAATPPAKFSYGVVGSNGNPEFSPDGNELIFQTVRNPLESRWYQGTPMILKTLFLETNEERDFPFQLDSVGGRIRWSRDSRSILVYGADKSLGSGVYEIDVATGKKVLIVANTGNNFVRQFQWSPDSASVFYMMNKGGSIMFKNISTGQEKKIVSDAADFDLSSDGRWLAITSIDIHKGIAILKTLPSDGGGVVHEIYRTNSPEFISALTWTPDGSIIFSKGRRDLIDNPHQLWKISRDGGLPSELGIETEYIYHIRVNPDGKRLVIAGSQDTSEVWVMENFLPPLQKAAVD